MIVNQEETIFTCIVVIINVSSSVNIVVPYKTNFSIFL